jgi:nucleotide-binding universal stress UspA family protein
MIALRHILCPVDQSETSRLALDYAVPLARRYGATLHVLGIGSPALPPVAFGGQVELYGLTPETRAELLKELEQLVARAAPGDVKTAVSLREGSVVQGILDEANALPAGLLVMGTHGRGGFDHLVLGSVTEKVLRKAACPVLTVPPSGASPGAAPVFRSIVCAVDFSPASMEGLKYALSLAQETESRLLLVHVIEWPFEEQTVAPGVADHRRDEEERAAARLHDAVPPDARLWSQVEESTAVGKPYREILRLARERNADLIVMGVQGRGALDLALFGSMTHHVIREAPCPVLTVRTAG